MDIVASATPSAGFHDGELAVQRHAGVESSAARLVGMMAPAELGGGIAHFLAERTFALLTGRDRRSGLWISPLAGPSGFLEVAARNVLAVHAVPGSGDPLHELPAGQPVGLLVIEFATRRRVRINGTLTSIGSTGLRIEVEQAFGNCPQYIRRRVLDPGAGGASEEPIRHADALTAADAALIKRSDTFFTGSTHPDRGVDASHRGGPAGFVRVENGSLWWPDYPGNNMFNTLGNLAVDPSAALLFADFTTGDTLHLSGTAVTEWSAPGGEDITGRRVRFTPRDLVAGRLLPIRAATDT